MFSHVLTTRPREKSEELARMLQPLGVEVLIQPAFEYIQCNLAENQPEDLQALSAAGSRALLIFTSPRAVWYSIDQLPRDALWQASKAAIGPATAHALKKAGSRADVVPAHGFTSEALLQTLEKGGVAFDEVYIVAAPGGRRKLADSLSSVCDRVRYLQAYESLPAEIDPEVMAQMGEADRLLTVWTSANAMRSLSQRLPPSTWFRVCQSDWLVISERLLRLARAYGPSRVHLSGGPGNPDLQAAIRELF